jgi:hypothetical protein
MFAGRQVLDEAAFMAARAGATNHADAATMKDTLKKALIPFYQNSTVTNPEARMTGGWGRAQADLLNPLNLKLDVLAPDRNAFTDFGLPGPNGKTYIPNDNLEYRSHAITGKSSGLTIQDANTLRIKVTYAYELKVPLMQTVFKSVLCGVDSGVKAFGQGNLPVIGELGNCALYYSRGRVPIVAYATVQMQTPAWQ